MRLARVHCSDSTLWAFHFHFRKFTVILLPNTLTGVSKHPPRAVQPRRLSDLIARLHTMRSRPARVPQKPPQLKSGDHGVSGRRGAVGVYGAVIAIVVLAAAVSCVWPLSSQCSRVLSWTMGATSASGQHEPTEGVQKGRAAASKGAVIALSRSLHHTVLLNLSLPTFDGTTVAPAGIVIFPQLFTEEECDKIDRLKILNRQDATIGGQSEKTRGARHAQASLPQALAVL